MNLAIRARPYVVVLGGAALLFLYPATGPSTRTLSLATTAVVLSIAATGLGLLWGEAGQLSIFHAANMGVGAYIAAGLLHTHRVGVIGSLPLAALGGAIVGFAIALVALRTSGTYFAILTFAFAQLAGVLALNLVSVTGGVDGTSVPQRGQSLFGLSLTDASDFMRVVALLLALCLCTYLLIRRSRWGLRLRGIRENMDLALSLGTNVALHRLLVFAAAGAAAGVGGFFYAFHLQYIAPDTFGTGLAVYFLLMIILGGRTYLLGPTVGAVAYTFLSDAGRKFSPLTSQIVFGALLVILILMFPSGILSAGGRLRRSFARRVSPQRIEDVAEVLPARRIAVDKKDPVSPPREWNSKRGSEQILLEVSGVVRRFGGVTAVADVDLAVEAGELLGIMGPNGSGKSTLFGIVSGFVRPDAGTVRWRGADVTRAPSYVRARNGLVRTFQERVAFDGISVREGLQFASRRNHGLEIRWRTESVIDQVGLPRGIMDQRASELSWGQSRLLGIAMALLTNPTMLLLDEPFAGLNRIAAREVIDTLKRVHSAGVTLVVVDHELPLLLELAHRIVVLSEGRKIADDSPELALSRPEVRNAYFGESVALSSAERERVADV